MSRPGLPRSPERRHSQAKRSRTRGPTLKALPPFGFCRNSTPAALVGSRIALRGYPRHDRLAVPGFLQNDDMLQLIKVPFILNSKKSVGPGACKPDSVQPPKEPGHPFICTREREPREARATYPGQSSGPLCPLFCLAPDWVCPARTITRPAVGSYSTISPLPLAETRGGIFSATLSVASA